MKILTIAAIGSVFVTLLACAGVSDDAKNIQGAWAPAEAELAGQPMPPAILKTISLDLHQGKYSVLVGTQPDKGSYQLAAAAKPRAITIKGEEGPNAGKTIPAIYELRGDTLKICYDLSGAQRPTAFKTAPGSRLYLVTYQRKQ